MRERLDSSDKSEASKRSTTNRTIAEANMRGPIAVNYVLAFHMRRFTRRITNSGKR